MSSAVRDRDTFDGAGAAGPGVTAMSAARIARVAGNAGWWVFVLARLMSELGLTLPGVPRRYTDYAGLQDGWSSYLPLTEANDGWRDPLTQSNVLMTVSLVALGVTVVAAVVQAVLARRLWLGAAVVAAPVVGGAIVLWSLAHRAGTWGADGPYLPVLVVFILVALGVAVRELGNRLRAPGAGTE